MTGPVGDSVWVVAAVRHVLSESAFCSSDCQQSGSILWGSRRLVYRVRCIVKPSGLFLGTLFVEHATWHPLENDTDLIAPGFSILGGRKWSKLCLGK